MTKSVISAMLLLFSIASWAQGQNACPTCTTQLPEPLPADTLYLAPAPNGRVGEFYSANISFRVPRTTTPVAAVDTTVAPGITINRITVTGLTNLPAGLSFHLPQAVFNLPDSTDGCVTICGMPLQPGTYLVNVTITAQVFVLSQQSTFTFPIVIEPAQSITDGFTMNNASGCGAVTVNFENNVLSGGAPGFSYFWDFGNGNFSPEENPVPQTYSMPGQYRIQYRAIVDTVGHILTKVRILQVGCSDLFNAPDLKVFLYAPDSSEVFVSAEFQNASLPLEVLINAPIGEGNYRLRVLDLDDGIIGGADDECGAITFNRTLSGELDGGTLRAFLELVNPVDTIVSVDTVEVFPLPDMPQIIGVPDGPLCDGELLNLSVNYPNGVQWYRDSLPVLPGDEVVLEVNSSGDYYVSYTSEDGCRVYSNTADIEFVPVPTVPAFTVGQNRLTLFDPNALPAFAVLQWYLNGEPLSGETGQLLCITVSGLYELEVTDAVTGCSNTYSLPVNYNPNLPNCVSSANETWLENAGVQLFPNPGWDFIDLRMQLETPTLLHWQLTDLNGRAVAIGSWEASEGAWQRRIEAGHLPSGVYFLKLQSNEGFGVRKWVKR